MKNWLRRSTFCAVLLCVVAVAHAFTITAPLGVSAEVTFYETGTQITAVFALVDKPTWEGWIEIRGASGNGGTPKGINWGRSYDGQGTTSTLTNGTTVGAWFCYRTGEKWGGAFQNVSGYTYFQAAGAPPKYYVTFPIPAGGAEDTHYFAKQLGLVVGQVGQPAGGAPFLWRVGPLDTPDPVTLHRITGGNVGDDGSGTPQIRGDTVSEGVGNPVTPAAGTSSSGGSTGPSNRGPGSPATPTPNQPDNPSPEPSPGPPDPDPDPEPNPAPDGPGAASKADMEKQTNDLIKGLNTLGANAHENSVATVNAINKASANNVSGLNGVIGAINKAKDATDKARASTDLLGIKIDKTN